MLGTGYRIDKNNMTNFMDRSVKRLTAFKYNAEAPKTRFPDQ